MDSHGISPLGLEGMLEQLLERAVYQALQREECQVLIRKAVREEVEAAVTRLPSSVDDDWLSVKTAARLAEYTEGTIRTWIREHRLQAEWTGRAYRILRRDLKLAIARPSSKRSDIIDIGAEASKIVSLDRQKRS